MSLAGKGAVAIWHDIAEEARNEFYAWHGNEHMPERAGIAGFLRGRRYVAIQGAPEYFNLYETVSHFTVTSPEYLARLNAPTPWTSSTVKHFRGVARSLCDVAASYGEGQGGLIATFRYDVEAQHAAAHRARLSQVVLPALASEPGVAGCHLLIADEAASAVETAERKLRAEANVIPSWTLLVESWDDVEPFARWCSTLSTRDVFDGVSRKPDVAIYRLQNSRCRFAWSAG